ncbi:ABA-responsive protein [Musa troglodytarum]|uniref:ABA-responsive protein n=1 Tax=Musa troglodytarum TaxID=320322 RepID=A0A9E7HMJ2_9LILI|nr:ABA-responsive protein [Musa troglodytarum]
MEKEAKEAAHVTEEAKWGTKLMGPPAEPSAHPENQRAALWSPRGDDERPPYVLEREPTAPSKAEAAMGKLSLTAKALAEGGFESLYKQTFQTDPTERLKKTFACYLSTTTGPVAGTLYLSNVNVAFCSDRPLSFTAPSGQQAWSYYKVMIPLIKIAAVNPVTLGENPPHKYIQIATVDGHDFWFMGFVHFEKASEHLLNDVSDRAAASQGAEHSVSRVTT